MDPTHARVLIVGSGAAGWSAAIYAARAALNPLVLKGLSPGGQLTITTDVENYPGFADTIQGPWLMEQMEAQALKVGTRALPDIATAADLSARPFRITGQDKARYTADALIIATGAEAKWLGLPSEEAWRGHGVSACATCDGFFFRNKPVLVVGGGNTAVEEALFLTRFASRVTLVHRRDQLRADKILQARLFANDKVTVLWDSVLEEVLGEENPRAVTGARLKNLKSGASSELAADGVFIAIGHEPASEIFQDSLKHRNGYLTTAPDSTATSCPGVFAAGDVADAVYRQAVTAAGRGCMAALDAERFLAAEEG